MFARYFFLDESCGSKILRIFLPLHSNRAKLLYNIGCLTDFYSVQSSPLFDALDLTHLVRVLTDQLKSLNRGKEQC
jgi:hypothetical protein